MANTRNFITELQQAKDQYDNQLAKLDLQYKVDKTVAKQYVIALIAEALDSGLSKNKVAIQGMGYAGIAPLKSFVGADSTEDHALFAAVKANKNATDAIQRQRSANWEPIIPDPIPVGSVFTVETSAGKILTYGLSTEWDAIMPEPDNDEEKAVNQLIYDRTHGTVKYAAAEQAEYGGK